MEGNQNIPKPEEDQKKVEISEKKLEIQNLNDNKEIKEKKYYKCTVPGCEMIFSKKCVLRDHQMAHKKEKPFKCQT